MRSAWTQPKPVAFRQSQNTVLSSADSPKSFAQHDNHGGQLVARDLEVIVYCTEYLD